MSRNKDKHEGASGRTYHIMSEAERASGRRGGWTTLEVTGGVRALAPQLFQLTHLTALYLNDNSLQRIPPDINQLANLHTLDISNNKLRSLPAELGDLIQLRELHLHNNYLRVLPYELGKLFHLQLLGLGGNPLSKEMLSIYNDNNGTAKLLTYMLDNLQGKITLPLKLSQESGKYFYRDLFQYINLVL
uniref:CCR4-NOT transcription complex subunit 6-like n=1 Tax=Heliothis virescens TaxID=7102 RepID=A0A2A4JY56_HELVI